MKKLILLLSFFSQFSFSQNLVPNPSFEIYDTCPNYLSQIYKAVGWHSTKNTPDYFNVCSIDTFPNGNHIVNVPLNGFGYRTPASGNAYSGIAAGIVGSGAREYLSAQLITSFQIGTKYYMSLKTSLAGQANPSHRCGINKLGILFSTVQYDSIFNAPICNCAQIVSDSIVADTLNWTTLSGSFIADSAYSFFNIGRFAYDSSTSSIQVLGTQCIAYYYIDNICISEDSTYCSDSKNSGIEENNNESKISIYPNPANDFINIDAPFLREPYNITIYDILGREVFLKEKTISPLEHIPIDNIVSNILFIKIAYKNQLFNYKLIKLKQ